MPAIPIPDVRAARARVVSVLTGLAVALTLVQQTAARREDARR